MAISLITSFVGTALNLQGAAKQRAIAAKAQREADIATQKSLKAIEKSGIVDIALPTKQYEMLTRQIEQQTDKQQRQLERLALVALRKYQGYKRLELKLFRDYNRRKKKLCLI